MENVDSGLVRVARNGFSEIGWYSSRLTATGIGSEESDCRAGAGEGSIPPPLKILALRLAAAPPARPYESGGIQPIATTGIDEIGF